jgi:hypothetical protein
MSQGFETNKENNAVTVLKRTVRIILLTLVLIAVCLAAALKIYESRKTLISESQSPNGTHSVRVYMIGDADFPFGYAHCRIDLKDTGSGKTLDRVKVDVANDGGPALEEDFTFAWREDRVDILVTGDEMDPVTVSLSF